MRVHDFNERRDFGDAAANEPFWEAVCREAFPGFVGMVVNGDKNPANSAGIDRLILLANGRTLRVDIKTRERFRDDVALEYAHRGRYAADGWMCKDLQIDHLLYGYLDVERAYVYPWAQLRRAWAYLSPGWFRKAAHPHATEREALASLPEARGIYRGRAGFALIRARNRDYDSLSLAVPSSVLSAAVARAFMVDLPRCRSRGGHA